MTTRDLSKLKFIEFALDAAVLRFGMFKTKAGRQSPYFFNAGLFTDGASVDQLGTFYSEAILGSDVEFDMLFGPAYKGITLAASTAIAMSRVGRNVPFAFNRKEAKDHGEGGMIVGAPLQGKVLIIDDVISAGTSIRESVDIIRAYGAQPCGVAVSLDRQEKGVGELSAIQEIEKEFDLPVISIFTLDDLIGFLSNRGDLHEELNQIQDYRKKYGSKSG